MKTRRVSGLGVGIDIVEVARIKKLAKKRGEFLAKVFTPGELAYCGSGPARWERLAARWAVKEAVIKALDRRDLPLNSIAVEKAETGRPFVTVKGVKTRLSVSISHTAAYACAAAVALPG